MSEKLQDLLDGIAAFEAKRRVGPLSKALQTVGKTRAFAAVYRHVGPKIDPKLAKISDGEFVAKVYGLPGLLIHTTGAKSGQPRSNPLLYVRDGKDFVVVGTNFGQPKHPAWTANLIAHPRASIEIGPHTLPVEAELVADEVWDRVWPRLVEVYPGYHNYLKRRGNLPPRMFLLHPVDEQVE